MKKISRRQFLGDSATLAILGAMTGALEGCHPKLDDSVFQSASGLQAIASNGMNLTFYFQNLYHALGHMRPVSETLPSYLIVQLPPQSLHEQYFYSNENKEPQKQLDALLSGPSFLAFQLWPDPAIRKTMPFTVTDLLRWDDISLFRLITTYDLDKGVFKKYNTADAVKSIGGYDAGSRSFLTYQALVNSIFNTNGKDLYITIFEMPANLWMVPRVTEQHIRAVMLQNIYKVSSKEQEVVLAGVKYQQRLEERWQAELVYRQTDPNNSKIYTGTLPPVLRALGSGGAADGQDKRQDDTPNGCQTISDPTSDTGYLPSMLDEKELIYLNQLAWDKTSGADFNIKTDGVISFSGLGVSAKINYEHYDLTGLDVKLSLVQYEHHFQDGRDNYIKVARIGIIAPSCHKALHIKIAQRRIRNGVSYMEYKEYLQLFDPVKQFLGKAGLVIPKSAAYKYQSVTVDPDVHDTSNAPRPDVTYINKIPFQSITANFKQTPPISPVGDCENIFWACNEGTGDLMQLSFSHTDRNNKPLDATAHPVMFMRRDFFYTDGKADNAVATFLDRTGKQKTASLLNFDDGRMRIPYHNQVVAFTHDDAEPDADAVHGNKLNQIVTEYADYYVDVAVYSQADTSRNIFDHTDLPIFPQIKRAKVFFDHIQQIGKDKIPSLIEYAQDYLDNGINKLDAGVNSEANHAKLILQHGPDFIKGELNNLIGRPEAAGVKYSAELQDGYKKISGVFSDASRRIGALVNPDVQIERFALVKQGLSLPADINKQWKGLENAGQNAEKRLLNSVDIFKGKAPEIFAGINLLQILSGKIPAQNSPVFNLNKIAGLIPDFDGLTHLFESNPAVKRVLTEIKKEDEDIAALGGKITSLQSTLAAGQANLIALTNKLHASLPDTTKVQTAFKNKLELSRLSFMNRVERQEITIQKHIQYEVLNKFQTLIKERSADFVNDVLNHLSFITDLKITIDTRAAQNSPAYVKLKTIVDADVMKIHSIFINNNVLKNILNAKDAGAAELVTLEKYINKEFDFITKEVNDKVQLAFDKVTAAEQIVNFDKIDWRNVAWQEVISGNTFIGDVTRVGYERLLELRTKIQGLEVVYDKKKLDVTLVIAAINTEINNKLAVINKSIWTLIGEVTAQLAAVYADVRAELDDTVGKQVGELLQVLDAYKRCTVEFYVNAIKTLDADYRDTISRIDKELQAFVISEEQQLQEDANALNTKIAQSAVFQSAVIAADNIIVEIKDVQSLVNQKTADLQTMLNQQILNLQDTADTVAKQCVTDIDKTAAGLKQSEADLTASVKDYTKKVRDQAQGFADRVQKKFNDELNSIVDVDALKAAKAQFDQVYRLLTTPQTQTLNYDWSTTDFKQADLGIVQFNPLTGNPHTALNVSVSASIHFDPLKYPSIIQGIETGTVNDLTDFSITFMRILTVEFARVRFRAGTNVHAGMDVSVRNVKFDGPLSFVQKLEELLGNLGDGFKLQLNADNVAISYNSPPLGVSTPTFTFTNITVGVILQVYFSSKPLEVTFTVGTPENKVTVAAVFLGGCFYLGMTFNPKSGLTALEMALEMGAFLGISLGPISGSVKFMVGIYIRKAADDSILEGYFIAEGTLSVWILSVSARLFMYIKSENSSVVGGCTVSYKVKVGFFSATFSGSFEKRIAGAAASPPAHGSGGPVPLAAESNITPAAHRTAFTQLIDQRAAFAARSAASEKNELDDAIAMLSAIDTDEYQVMEENEWTEFYELFYS